MNEKTQINMTFGLALIHMKYGEHIRRRSWKTDRESLKITHIASEDCIEWADILGRDWFLVDKESYE